MIRRRSTVIISVIAAIVIVLGMGTGVYFFLRSGGSPFSGGVIEEATTTPPPGADAGNEEGKTDIISGASTTAAPTTVPTTAAPTTRLTAEEAYVKRFMEELESYTSPPENAQAPRTYNSGRFNVVTTPATITDSTSLEGLEGTEKTVGEIILAAGFRYDSNQNIFYSDSNSWQRYFGFTPLYDAGAALTGMYYDTIRIDFPYNGLNWRFQNWKGRYGITTGAEMGIYWQEIGAQNGLYNTATEEMEIPMSYAIYRGDELYMTRGPERHWWLTGFRIFDMVDPKELTMHATWFFEDAGFADAFEQAIIGLGFVQDVNYQRLGLTMTIIWN